MELEPSVELDTDLDPPSQTTATGDDALVEDELLVEEISIDGMCGVY